MRRGASLGLAVLLAGVFGLEATCRAGVEALPDSRLGVRTAPLLLLSRSDVQADLQLSRTQVDEGSEAIRTLQAKAAALRGTTGQKLLEARREIDALQQRWIEEHLSESQQKRIVQIDLQWEGAAALVSRPVLSEMLALTADQRAGLRLAVDESTRQRAAGRDLFEVQKKLSQEAIRLLSERQKERWMEILGRPYQPRVARGAAAVVGPQTR
jgi:hypothetical protein